MLRKKNNDRPVGDFCKRPLLSRCIVKVMFHVEQVGKLKSFPRLASRWWAEYSWLYSVEHCSGAAQMFS